MVIKILGLRLENKKGQQNLLTFFIELKSESTDKPGSVVDNHSSGTNVTACLKQPTRPQRGSRHMGTYLVLLRVGFTMPLLLPAARCALTAPFHPYLATFQPPGGLLSVALSVGFRPPGVTWHSALWSPDFPPPELRKRCQEAIV